MRPPDHEWLAEANGRLNRANVFSAVVFAVGLVVGLTTIVVSGQAPVLWLIVALCGIGLLGSLAAMFIRPKAFATEQPREKN